MPTYEYVCRQCGHTFEEFQSMTEEPLTRCPECGTDNLARVMGTGGGIIFKGSGFYITDYRNTGASGRTDAGKRASDKKENAAAKSGGEPGGTGKGETGNKEQEKKKGAEKSGREKGTSGSQSPPSAPPSGPSEKKD